MITRWEGSIKLMIGKRNSGVDRLESIHSRYKKESWGYRNLPLGVDIIITLYYNYVNT